MDEAYSSKLIIHPGNNEMYHKICKLYWWPGIKKVVDDFVYECVTTPRVKA